MLHYEWYHKSASVHRTSHREKYEGNFRDIEQSIFDVFRHYPYQQIHTGRHSMIIDRSCTNKYKTYGCQPPTSTSFTTFHRKISKNQIPEKCENGTTFRKVSWTQVILPFGLQWDNNIFISTVLVDRCKYGHLDFSFLPCHQRFWPSRNTNWQGENIFFASHHLVL